MVALIYFPSTKAPVSSTSIGLTSVFGMGTGVSLYRINTTKCMICMNKITNSIIYYIFQKEKQTHSIY